MNIQSYSDRLNKENIDMLNSILYSVELFHYQKKPSKILYSRLPLEPLIP